MLEVTDHSTMSSVSNNDASMCDVSSSSSTSSSPNKDEMFNTFQSWALQNYGDNGKTKTVTRKKYDRIVKILSGEEKSSAENSKFRFWVKAKGFRLGPKYDRCVNVGLPETLLYVPTKPAATDGNSNDADRCYKRVAVVEDFFDIIYSVHVEMDGRGGKHAGQKRTYRAIAETYAFLPREAVTRFLMSCADCQKRMHLGSENVTPSDGRADTSMESHVGKERRGLVSPLPAIDFSVPITQTYINQMRNRGYFYRNGFNEEESMSSNESLLSGERSPSPRPADSLPFDTSTPLKEAEIKDDVDSCSAVNLSAARARNNNNNNNSTNNNNNSNNGTDDDKSTRDSKSPVHKPDVGHPERKRRASNDSCESSNTRASELGIIDDLQREKDDDDEDEEDEDKVPAGKEYDPERLKSFNMFVRLFVDENLDRMVPISKQPKDKIQAILEACDRQFPEFHERSRKRIRTYLKSCRRMRRSKEQNGWEPLRPTPPHLTSALAEQYLAQACENESQNAKRMRMGLEPLPASSMSGAVVTNGSSTSSQSASSNQQPPRQHTPQQTTPALAMTTSSPKSQTPSSRTSPTTGSGHSVVSDFLRHQPAPAFRPPHEFHPTFFSNGNGLFRPGFPPGYQSPAHHHPSVIPHSPVPPTSVQNGDFGPTDLSMKKQSSKNQLSTSEVSTIKQLISGYRESAAFLYRSADELEQLLLHQN